MIKKDGGLVLMEMSNELSKISTRIVEKGDIVETEEATKTAFILPFIRLVLGYDHTDPEEVVPEFGADVGKKGEKTDYAIMHDGKPMMIFECKPANTDLKQKHISQLYRYFSVTDAKFGILTNGIHYRFYTDIDAPNKMDKKPFFELENILESACELKYKNEMKKLMAEEFKNPSDEFVKFYAKEVYSGRFIGSVKDQFKQITQRALKEYINERVDERLKKALESENPEGPDQEKTILKKDKNEIVTTEDEWEGYYIVKSILSNIVDPSRVTIRDRVSYCTVLLDNNQNKLICRMHFNKKQKYIGLFDKQDMNNRGAKIEDKIPIDNVNEIYKHTERLRNTTEIYI